MNSIDQHFSKKPKENLAVYFTAGYPDLDRMPKIIQELENNGVDLIEIGIPYSDPLADGPVIQNSGNIALANGFTIQKMFDVLHNKVSKTKLPLILMGYLNPVLQFGFEHFLEKAASCGVSGIILPDLPADLYERDYKQLYALYNIYPIFLVTPQTSDVRIRFLDSLSKGFLYAVSSSTTTGTSASFTKTHASYFERLAALKLNNPVMIGFGISSNEHLKVVWEKSSGAVVGSAFIKNLNTFDNDLGIATFMNQLLNNFSHDHSA